MKNVDQAIDALRGAIEANHLYPEIGVDIRTVIEEVERLRNLLQESLKVQRLADEYIARLEADYDS